MTSATAIKKLLERREARLTEALSLIKSVEDTKKLLADQIDRQRAAYDGLIADGFSSEELADVGIERLRKPATSTQRKAPATSKTVEKPASPADPPSYDEQNMTPLSEGTS
ncbi:hypothetical protein [Mycobacteroides abscessus]|uniref:hypothetical protein n=1 Tax=Mycobacteroides abscessus TaxID=36809 RepID=UPI002104B3C7|nr:hypothetical protein [Mycobacteroides abscessus]